MLKKVIPTLSIFLLSFILVGRATPAAAADGISIDAGYQFLWSSSSGQTTTVPLGATAGVSIPLSSPWSVVGDVSWGQKSDIAFAGSSTTILTFGAGARYTPVTMSTFAPYFQAVVGIERTSVSGTFAGFGSVSSSDSNLMIQPGVGGTFAAGPLKAFVEGDYRRVFATVADNDLVVRAGIVLTLGK